MGAQIFSNPCVVDSQKFRTASIEFRYGADADALGQYDAGDYAYWLASGITTDCDQTMIDSCIQLFCTENLAEKTENSMQNGVLFRTKGREALKTNPPLT